MQHDYPGNIRELQNIIEHTVIMCPAATIGKEYLPEYLLHTDAKTPVGTSIPDNVRLFEKQEIAHALELNHYNRQKTAQQLGIHPTTLWRKMKKLGID
jgi:transcriptional regulator with PAS, ATPase and Fis domain